MRIFYFMGMYLEEAPYEVCLKLANSEKILEELRKVKRNEMGNLEWAKRESKWLCEVTKEMKDNWIEKHPGYQPDKEVDKLFNDVVVECMRISFKGEL